MASSNGTRDRRLEALERLHGKSTEGYWKYVGRRIRIGYLEEHGDLTSPRFRRAKKVKDRKAPSEAVELWGEGYPSDWAHEEAIRRLASKLESKYLRPGCNTNHDLRPHVPQWWFSPSEAHQEELIELLTEVIEAFGEQARNWRA